MYLINHFSTSFSKSEKFQVFAYPIRQIIALLRTTYCNIIAIIAILIEILYYCPIFPILANWVLHWIPIKYAISLHILSFLWNNTHTYVVCWAVRDDRHKTWHFFGFWKKWLKILNLGGDKIRVINWKISQEGSWFGAIFYELNYLQFKNWY